jgi:hypothetical protein
LKPVNKEKKTMTLKSLARMALALAMVTPLGLAQAAPKTVAAIPAPPAGKGQVIFWRPGTIVGAAIRCTVREGGKMVGRLSVGKYFVLTAEPGTHQYSTKTEATDTLNIQVEADEVSYVRCKIGAGVGVGRGNLSPSTKAEFDAKAKKLKPMNAEELAKEMAEDSAK